MDDRQGAPESGSNLSPVRRLPPREGADPLGPEVTSLDRSGGGPVPGPLAPPAARGPGAGRPLPAFFWPGVFVLLAVLAALGGLVWALWPPGPDGRENTPQADAGPPWFVDVTDEVELDFTHDAGPVGDYFMPQQVGSGAALFDFDNDGRLDIYLLQNGGPKSKSTNRLFRQLENGKFQDVSAGSGLDINGYNMGVAVGDVNNDGLPDVLVTQYTGVKRSGPSLIRNLLALVTQDTGVKLFLNLGNGKFRDVTAAAGLENPSWGTSAAFFDYNRDGWLDIALVCYVDYDPSWPCTGPNGKRDYCAPKTFKGRVSRLFRNLGPEGAGEAGVRFQDVTIESGLGRLPGPGLGVLCADFDGDGWPDIFIANDGEPNRLWINQRDGKTFREESVRRGVAYNAAAVAQAGMGIAYGDVDGDRLLDVFVTHLAEETHTLWRQGPPGLYLDRTTQSGILKSHWRGTGFGTLFGDFTNSGRLDLALANGGVSAQPTPGDGSLGPFWSHYGQRNQLFAGDGAGHFRDVSLANPAFCGKMNVARGLAAGDFNRDGGLDLLVTTIAGRARLYRNVAPNRGHWLSVRAFDPALKRDALGTRVEVSAGGRRQVRWLHPAESYLCSSEPRAHFGLGPAARVERIEVTWPDGVREAFPGRAADRAVEVRRGKGRPVKP
jgi:enediyne biosynthesis protein E4